MVVKSDFFRVRKARAKLTKTSDNSFVSRFTSRTPAYLLISVPSNPNERSTILLAYSDHVASSSSVYAARSSAMGSTQSTYQVSANA